MPSRPKPVRRRASPARSARIVLMESISERERPRRHLKEHFSAMRTFVRAVIWVGVFLATLWVLTWRLAGT